MFTLLLEHNLICEQKWIQFELYKSPSRVFAFDARYALPFNKPVKANHN